MNSHSIESYLVICHSAYFSSKISVTMKTNKLFKLKNKVQNRHQLYTMNKNKLFKLKNNQSAKQVSITMKKNKLFKV